MNLLAWAHMNADDDGFIPRLHGARFKNGDTATGYVTVEDSKLWIEAIDSGGNAYDTQEMPVIRWDFT